MLFTANTIKGSGLGRKIGYPTINLASPSEFNVKKGVYGCSIKINKEKIPAILYFGPKKFGDNLLTTLEIHLLLSGVANQSKLLTEIEQNGQLSVELGKFIRHPVTFPDLKSLKNQIKKDINKLTGRPVEKMSKN